MLIALFDALSRVVDIGEEVCLPATRSDGRDLFYLAPDNRLMAVAIRLDSERNTVEAGAPIPLFAARLSGNPQGGTQRQYTVSADGQRFLINAPVEVTLPITVVLNREPNP